MLDITHKGGIDRCLECEAPTLQRDFEFKVPPRLAWGHLMQSDQEEKCFAPLTGPRGLGHIDLLRWNYVVR